ncbi:MAG: hypothetical protein GY847_27035 [Proteobacteria bacterium]|nr:hypothetical protein [Pseudomonadota bacterium]
MSSSDRTIPPGRGRIAKAARAGMFPRSSAIAGGLALLASAAVLALFAEQAGHSFMGLVEQGLDYAVASRPEPGLALNELIKTGVWLILPLILAAFVGGLAGAVVPAVIARRHRGRTAVPLPRAPKERVAFTVLHVFAVFLVILFAAHILRSHMGAVTRLIRNDPGSQVELIYALSKLLAAGGAVMLLMGLAEIALLRHSLWRALHINSLEARREERAAGGDSTVKTEGMRRARHEVRQ